MKQIAQAYVKAQSEMSNAIKGNTNPFFKSKYADLNSIREAVLPILNANKIAILQPIVYVDGKNFIRTTLIHESGEMLDNSLTEIVYSKQNDAQAQGSGITYARRYALQSLVCVGADDDDGNKASHNDKKPDNTEANEKEQARRIEVQLDLDSAGTIEELAEKYTALSGTDKVVFKKYVTDLKSKLTK